MPTELCIFHAEKQEVNKVRRRGILGKTPSIGGVELFSNKQKGERRGGKGPGTPYPLRLVKKGGKRKKKT